MKILVLMPCDERLVHYCSAIYQALPNETRDKTFFMPMFMDYLVTSKQTPNWTYALFDAILAAEALYKANDETPDAAAEPFILFGNIDKKYKFDKVFNFQDAEFSLPYEDKFIQRVIDLVASEPLLTSKVAALHEANESVFSLKNCIATADFVSNYALSDQSVAAVEKRYQEQLKELELPPFKGDDLFHGR